MERLIVNPETWCNIKLNLLSFHCLFRYLSLVLYLNFHNVHLCISSQPPNFAPWAISFEECIIKVESIHLHLNHLEEIKLVCFCTAALETCWLSKYISDMSHGFFALSVVVRCRAKVGNIDFLACLPSVPYIGSLHRNFSLPNSAPPDLFQKYFIVIFN